MATIFTRIINGEIPCTKVYEDEFCFGFLDINPVTKGHTLLIPKEEYEWMQEVPDDLLSHMFLITKQLMAKMLTNLEIDYVQINIEGIDVPHFHIHLMPTKKDIANASWQHTSYIDGEAEQIAAKIR